MIKAGTGKVAAPMMSEHLILAFIAAIKQFRSVVEFRCGHGKWLRAARALGATELRGYDGPGMPAEPRGLLANEFFPADFTQFIKVDRTFDLSLCREGPRVADRDSGAHLVRTLCEASNCVLFAADLPGKGGSREPNDRWIESWAQLFQANGFVCYDILRGHFWRDREVAVHYRQNACLYVRPGAHYAFEARGYRPVRRPRTLVHPDSYVNLAAQIPEQPDVEETLRSFYRHAARAGASGAA
jgi:hypothetical protein